MKINIVYTKEGKTVYTPYSSIKEAEFNVCLLIEDFKEMNLEDDIVIMVT